MKHAILDVGGMLSALDFLGVEKQLKRIPGVHAATVNIASNTAVVDYDETITTVDALRRKIIACGFQCCGEVLPAHVCKTQMGGGEYDGQQGDKSTRD